MADETEPRRKIEEGDWLSGLRLAFGSSGESVSEDELVWMKPESGPASRYEIHDELARDSASILHLARDREVDRDVTLRVLGGDGNGDETSVRRFLEEAQVGAQLQHPGILPVYGLGVLEDGRAYVASRVVEGEPLVQLQERGETSERLLGILEQAAHALAYAHARGVAHGALDANRIHVGAHGEVVISGWERAVRASWDARRIDADVRALLDLLGSVVGKRLSGNLKSAGAVARAIGKHLAGREARVREAEIAGARTRVRAEQERVRAVRSERQAVRERAARQRTLGLAAAVLLALSLGFGGYVWRKGEEVAEQDRVGAQVTRALREAKRHETAGDWAEARAWAAKALALSPEAGSEVRSSAEALRKRVEAVSRLAGEDAAVLARLEQLRLEVLLEFRNRDLSMDRTRAFREFGDIGLELPTADPRAAATAILARTRPREYAAELDFWAAMFSVVGSENLIATAELVDPDPWRRAVLERDADGVRALASTADVAAISPRTLFLFASKLCWADENMPLAASVLREALLRRPDCLAVLRPSIEFLTYLSAGLRRPARRGYFLRTVNGPVTMEGVSRWAMLLARHPRHAPAWCQLGTLLVRAGEIDRARAALLRSLELDPNQPASLPFLATSLAECGDVGEAVTCARRAIALDPDSAVAYYGLGTILCDQAQDYDGAARAFREAIGRGLAGWEIHRSLQRAYGLAGKRTEAAMAAKRVHDLVPDSEPLVKLVARGHLHAVRGEHEEAVGSAREALRIDSGDDDALLLLAVSLLNLRRSEEAVPVLRKAIEAQRNGPALLRLHILLTDALLRSGRLAEALAAAERLLVLDPEDTWAHLMRGGALEHSGSADEALSSYRRVVSLAGDAWEGHYRLGALLLKLGRPREAIGALENAVELEADLPGDPRPPANRRLLKSWAWLDLGSSYGLEGRPQDAVSAFRKAIALDLSSPAAASAHRSLGGLFLRGGKVREAIVELRRATELEPANPNGRKFLAEALQASGAVEEATAAWREALRLGPEDPSVLNNLAWVLVKRPQPSPPTVEEALRLVEKAVRLEPQNVWYLNTLGVALVRAGRYEEGIDRLTASRRAQGEQNLAYDGFFLAIAYSRLGQQDEARAWYERSVRWMNENRAGDEDLRGFRTEARDLLGEREE